MIYFFFSRRRRHTCCALVTGVQTWALPISAMRSWCFATDAANACGEVNSLMLVLKVRATDGPGLYRMDRRGLNARRLIRPHQIAIVDAHLGAVDELR